MMVKNLISALRTAPLDSRKASMDIYDLCVEAASVLETYRRNIERIYIDLLGYIPDDIDPIVSYEGHGWIPVSERLPEDDDCVLAVVNGKPKENIELVDSIEIASFWLEDGWVLSAFPEWEDPRVSYWMPLPRTPAVPMAGGDSDA